jgi:ferredoxin-NADP reductase
MKKKWPQLIALSLALIWTVSSHGQTKPEDHSVHHPGQNSNAQAGSNSNAQAKPTPTSSPGPNEKGAGMGQMMGESGGMGEMMGAPPPKELYPTLMDLPSLTPERRAEIERLAHERMTSSREQMSAASSRLTDAVAREDYVAMQQATADMREATAQFESGLAVHRALAEGKAPRNIALQWFKQEMNLLPAESDRGLSVFHVFTMALLIAFALTMLVMYFFKMRRASALFGRIDPGKGPPPPGSAPPLTGSPGPFPSGGGKDASGGPTPEPRDSQQLSAETLDAPPLTKNWAGQLRVETIVTETPQVKTVRLASGNGSPLPFTFLPGQFLNIAFAIGGARMTRSYSISSSPAARSYVELTVKREPRGAVSRHICDLVKIGDSIEAGGPVGTFTFTGTEANSIVLIAGGVGITPLMSVTRYLTERSWPGDIFFIYAGSSEEDFIFRNAIADLAQRNPRLHVTATLEKPSPEWNGPRGRISKELLMHSVPNLAMRRVHVCGPVPMLDAVKSLLREIGVPPENIKSEQFGAVKPAIAAAATTATRIEPATGPLVTFSKSNKAARLGIDRTGEQAALNTGSWQTILELSEELGIGIDFSCRIGVCGVCKVRMTAGEVDMAVQDALDDDDKVNSIILACQAKPKTDVTVEA